MLKPITKTYILYQSRCCMSHSHPLLAAWYGKATNEIVCLCFCLLHILSFSHLNNYRISTRVSLYVSIWDCTIFLHLLHNHAGITRMHGSICSASACSFMPLISCHTFSKSDSNILFCQNGIFCSKHQKDKPFKLPILPHNSCTRFIPST